ncbi:hypothetical protein [Vampirovibrio chlorellavorus]|uniref:hypothetical protein n=1 Tax=Vampirovibrio chlorellavorus TaxID=758823 RepID=UPI0026F14EB7|nr:hypothetical protein [Vampirovibrio chlorellavorus]
MGSIPIPPTPRYTPSLPLPPYPQGKPAVTMGVAAGLAPLSAYQQAGLVAHTVQDQAILQQSLILLGQVRHLPGDDAYLRGMGVWPVFQNGQQALQTILQKGIRVEFGDMGDSPAHAQWIAEQNRIMINQRYRGDSSPATRYAISEALYHEAGHAAGNGDDQSSIQEELNCLALNTLAHRYHRAINPYYGQTATHSPLLSDGVALYAQLFFDSDPQKRALIRRVVQKYGDLPLESPGHPVPYLGPGMAWAPRSTGPMNVPTPLAQQIKTAYWLQQASPPIRPIIPVTQALQPAIFPAL